MKKLFYFVVSLLLMAVSVTIVNAQTSEECTSLVNQTAAAIEENALQTLARINRAEHPYKNKDNPSLYVFVLNPEQTIVGHPIKTKKLLAKT